MKQAEEFGLAAQGFSIVPMSFQNVDIHAVGLQATKGNLILTSFFEDASPAARRFSDKFYRRRNAMPSQIQAGVYSAERHYLQTVKGQPDPGDVKDEGDADLRCLRARGKNPRGSAHGA